VRTAFVPAGAVSAVDFGITPAQSQGLYAAGLAAGRDFLRTWDFDAYVRTCRS
jgi:NTE family protein